MARARTFVFVALASAALFVAPIALAQSAQSVAAEKPAAEHAAPAGSEHEGAEEGHHEFGPPPAFNFADRARYEKESNAEKDGKGGPPVVPYVYVLVNALILYTMYYVLGKKPIGEGLKARRDAVAKELEEAATIKAEAEAKLDEYSERLDKLDQELERMKKELVLAGEKDRDRIVKEAEERAERMKKDAQFLLDQELKQLRIDLQKYAVEAAMKAAEKTLESRVSAEDRQRIADEYVSMIGKLPEPGAKGAVTKTRGVS